MGIGAKKLCISQKCLFSFIFTSNTAVAPLTMAAIPIQQSPFSAAPQTTKPSAKYTHQRVLLPAPHTCKRCVRVYATGEERLQSSPKRGHEGEGQILNGFLRHRYSSCILEWVWWASHWDTLALFSIQRVLGLKLWLHSPKIQAIQMLPEIQDYVKSLFLHLSESSLLFQLPLRIN